MFGVFGARDHEHIKRKCTKNCKTFFGCEHVVHDSIAFSNICSIYRFCMAYTRSRGESVPSETRLISKENLNISFAPKKVGIQFYRHLHVDCRHTDSNTHTHTQTDKARVQADRYFSQVKKKTTRFTN